ncbi:hypothetical protein MWU61_01855 [Loktanella sp. F6476L]|uniref:hypothetical protein n=1 Tax=Loktanella sp. F6476L TaxID=2926405 RepID=UPI001FF353AB|nr:hypothetical protein [Loktanella sp. F6476L]MCK0119269.1 hypothetical protein [Loktanella sp. F6476L]
MLLFCGAPVASQKLDQLSCATPQNYVRVEISFANNLLTMNEQPPLTFTQTTADKLTNQLPDNVIFAGAMQLKPPAHLPPTQAGFILFEGEGGHITLSEYFITQIDSTSLAFAPVEEIMSLRRMTCTTS